MIDSMTNCAEVKCFFLKIHRHPEVASLQSATFRIDIGELPEHLFSSDQSGQSGNPSQTDSGNVHVPSSHLNIADFSDVGSNVLLVFLRPLRNNCTYVFIIIGNYYIIIDKYKNWLRVLAIWIKFKIISLLFLYFTYEPFLNFKQIKQGCFFGKC